ncbi:UDP-glycosyltransferase 83A1-like [Abrus precatorius]|uniref:UDP-glycosyltransferase 83A1-like n=1 Tax=Abrus precatorius TaxID=3816 RepID=A0A8B8L555_ABRPR|nr:UDP-glycosyltransferase 83A1-like [Abrus precatorius]
MGIPHFLAIPYPILGHMNPLLQFSMVLINKICKVTFVISDGDYNKLKSAFVGQSKVIESHINVVSLPDGVDSEDDRKDQTKVIKSTINNMHAKLPKLIKDINDLDSENKISCIIVTKNMGWALQVGLELGIKGALFWPASATSLISFDSIQRLVDEGYIDSKNGLPTRKQEIKLSSNLPMMDGAAMPWYCLDSAFFFLHMKQEMQNLILGEWWLCNTTFDLEAGAFSTSPKLLPIGPLVENEHNISLLWQEDTACLDWLDQQPPQSVIYVAFGSMASIEQSQFKELALALDLLKRPFIWVVRKDNGSKVNNEFPDEFRGTQGKIVGWAPQKKILSHPSLACFISHCGWNSTMEGVYNGVPFLCWPFCSDQLMNKTYICDVWKVGLGFDKDENGLILREEIKKKVEQLLEDDVIKVRSLKLMEMVIKNKVEGEKNINKFINWANQK